MPTKIEVRPSLEFKALVVKKSVKTLGLKKAIQGSYRRLSGLISEAGLEISIPPFVRYNQIPWGRLPGKFKMLFRYRWNLEIGIPVSGEFAPPGGIEMVSYQTGPCLKTLHHGSYAKVGLAYQRLLDHARSQGLNLQDVSYEFYVNDPQGLAVEDLLTEVLIPLDPD